jgi:WD40 repeat protein
MFKRVLCFHFLFASMTLSAVIINQSPIETIEGPKSLLNRPEGIAFSPCGNYVAIANSEGENVLFYYASDCKTSNSQASPVFVIGGVKSPVGYPHDLDFSPDGEHLAVACRVSNQIKVYKRNKNNGFYEQEPFAVIQGNQAKFHGINAVKYDPTGKSLGICDVWGHQVALFRFDGEAYELLPYQVITAPLNIFNLPDGLAFSKDGKLLAITCHGNHSLLLFEKIPFSEEMFNPVPVEILKGQETYLNYPHSVCFHPLDDSLIISNASARLDPDPSKKIAGNGITLSLYKKISDSAPRYSPFPSQTLEIYNRETIHLSMLYKEEGGVKGIAFSQDGKILGLCSSDIANPSKSLLFYRIE